MSDPVEGDQFWFTGVNSGDTYIGEVVYFEPRIEDHYDEDWAQPRVMLRPLIGISTWADNVHVSDQKNARWVQWCRLSEVVPVEK